MLLLESNSLTYQQFIRKSCSVTVNNNKKSNDRFQILKKKDVKHGNTGI
jgi:hypothetical protein